MKKIQDSLLNKLSSKSILSDLDELLTFSELNSFLLELFRLKTSKLTSSRVLQQFTENRFTRPSSLDPIALKEIEIEWLQFAKSNDYKPIHLSPLCPIGTCSVIGKADQNKIVTALRGTEVVADATNVLTLKIAQEVKKHLDKNATHRYVTVHQHMRAQHYDNPAFNAHFAIYCMVSGAFDKGNYTTEWRLFYEQFEQCYQLLAKDFKEEELVVRLYFKKDIPVFRKYLDIAVANEWKTRQIEFMAEKGTPYYEVIQFKIFLITQDQEIDLADGGFVDWSRQLLSNQKHRLFTSGIGIERVLSLRSQMKE